MSGGKPFLTEMIAFNGEAGTTRHTANVRR